MRWSGGEWRLAPHLDLLSREAAHVADRPVRLIVSLPVRHGKSLLLSVWTPIWLLSNWPGKRVILASYEASFAASWGRKKSSAATRKGHKTVGTTPTPPCAPSFAPTSSGV